jgi:hypothetical protein
MSSSSRTFLERTFLTQVSFLVVGTIMFESVRLFATVSRAEFMLPNLGSLIMGLAWGASPPSGFIDGVILVVLSFDNKSQFCYRSPSKHAL